MGVLEPANRVAVLAGVVRLVFPGSTGKSSFADLALSLEEQGVRFGQRPPEPGWS